MPANPSRVDCKFPVRMLLIACAVTLMAASDEARYAAERKSLMAEVQRDAAVTAGSTGLSRFSTRVTGAMEKVPRHRFVPPLPDMASETDTVHAAATLVERY